MKTKAARLVCATDLSANARSAADVAAAIAQRLGARLSLVHVADETNTHAATAAEFRRYSRPIHAALREETRRLRQTGVEVDTVLLRGNWAEQAIAEHVTAHPTELVVMAAVSKTAFNRWTVGSVSERLVERSPVPVLVVRDPPRLLNWVREARTLRVLVAVDFTLSSDAALAWVARLRRIGACRITVAHVNWPPVEANLRTSGDVRELFKLGPKVRRQMARDLRRKIDGVLAAGDVTLRVEPSWGPPDAALVTAAAEADADLVVTGAHQRHGIGRMLHGSIARGVVRHAASNVACVPTSFAIAHGVRPPPRIRRLLIATDFSSSGDQAVPWGYAVVPSEGVVRLIHVLPPWQAPSPLVTRYERKRISRAEYKRVLEHARRRLIGLVPPQADGDGIRTETQVIVDANPARAIGAEARRWGADAICLGSRGHGAIASALLGSVARNVFEHSHLPVLLARPSPS